MFWGVDLAIGAMILTAFGGGLIARRVGFPRASGYILVGAIFSPYHFGLLSEATASGISDVLTPMALGIIAYDIGGTLSVAKLRGLKKTIAIVSVSEATCVWLGVMVFLLVLGPSLIARSVPDIDIGAVLPMAIAAAAISMATAPVVTTAVVREFGARGPLTSTLFGVVAVDNSVAIVSFAVGMGLVQMLVSGAEGLALVSGVGGALLKVVASWALGAALALPLVYLGRYINRGAELMVLVVGDILLADGLAQAVGLSGLLACLGLGIAIANMARADSRLLEVIRDFEEVVFVLFLTLVGTHFDFGQLAVAGPLALLIVAGRCVGKFGGATIGAHLAGAPEVVRRYLGLTLLAKAGLTVGLVMLVAKELPIDRLLVALLVNAILTSTLINELLAPPLVKYALFKSGEVSGTAVQMAH